MYCMQAGMCMCMGMQVGVEGSEVASLSSKHPSVPGGYSWPQPLLWP